MPYDTLEAQFPDLEPSLKKLSSLEGDFDAVPAGKHAMAVMGIRGDTKHMWDPTVPDEVDAAKNLYTNLTGKGYRAYRVRGKDGERGEQMTRFDPEAGRIIFVPQMQGG